MTSRIADHTQRAEQASTVPAQLEPVQEKTIMGFCESLELGRGFICVSGWVAWADKSPIVGEVEIRIADMPPFHLNEFIRRRDVEQYGVTGGRCGFHALIRTEFPVSDPLEVYARVGNAPEKRLLILKGANRPFRPEGGFFEVSSTRIYGWLRDPEAWITNIPASIVIDDKLHIPVDTSIEGESTSLQIVGDFGQPEDGHSKNRFSMGPNDILQYARNEESDLYPFDGGVHSIALVSSGHEITREEVLLDVTEPRKVVLNPSTASIEPAITKSANGHRKTEECPKPSVDNTAKPFQENNDRKVDTKANQALNSASLPTLPEVVDVAKALHLVKSRISAKTQQVSSDHGSLKLPNSELQPPDQSDLPLSAAEVSELLGRKEEQLEAAEELAAKRSSDLAAITLYLQTLDHELETLRSQAAGLSKELNKANSKNSQLQEKLTSLQDQTDRLIFVQGVSAQENTKKLANAEQEWRLLCKFLGSGSTDTEVYNFAVRTGLFDSQWYTSSYSLGPMEEHAAFEHYATEGYRRGFNPSACFSTVGYFRNIPKVDPAESNPLYHYIRFGLFERTRITGIHQDLKIRVIMMQRNERDLIYPWVLYHGARFGFDNLYILDNGSDDETQERLGVVQSFGTNVDFSHNSRDDFKEKGTIIAERIQEMDDSDPADFYFPLDCDEFIGVELDKDRFSFNLEDIVEELSHHVASANALNVKVCLDNHPALPGSFKRVDGQRKSFFAQGACAGLDRGFNNPKVKAGKLRANTRMVYVHYHHKPFALLRAHARQRLEIFIDDFTEENLRQYIGQKRPGFHSARYLMIDEHRYLAEIDKNQFKPVDSFVEAFAALGMVVPFGNVLANDQRM